MTNDEAALVPELIVDDLDRSLEFYIHTLGFRVRHARLAERFVYLERGGAQLMLQEPIGRMFLAAAPEHPYGRGMHLQITIDDVEAAFARVGASGVRMLLALEEHWYRTGDMESGVLQFVFEDPDGYVLRFAQDIGTRTIDQT